MIQFLLLALLGSGAAQALTVDLNWDRLTPSLKIESLTTEDRQVLDQAISLIRKGDHNLAIIQLKQLVHSNNANGGIRVLLAYALLNAGNQLGAFGEAKTAEKVAHDGYVCLFLAKVAFLVGDHSACRREIKHVQGLGDPTGEAAALAKELEAAKKRPRKQS